MSILFIIPPENFYDEQLFIPIQVLQEIHIPWVVASTQVKPIQGVFRGCIPATLQLEEINIASFATICVVGGCGTIQHLWYHSAVEHILQYASQAKKWVTGIGAGACILAHVGLLVDLEATCYPIDIQVQQLKAGQAQYTAHQIDIHTQQKIITANGPQGATAYGYALAQTVTTFWGAYYI